MPFIKVMVTKGNTLLLILEKAGFELHKIILLHFI